MATTIGNELDQVAHATGLPVVRVEPTIRLLEEGNTVPFIARYRKDQTGGLDDDQVRLIQRHAVRLKALMERKQTILKAIQSQGKLTDALAERVNGSRSWRSLEDLYLPYKPKKRTLAEVARRRGLEPLAEEILTAQVLGGDLDQRLTDFVTADNGLPLNADVLLGVGHLLAEGFIERADLRSQLRKIYRDTAELTCRFVANRPPRSPADDSGLPVAHGAQPGSEPASSEATPGPKSSGAADADGECANLSAATSPNDATEQTQHAAVAGEQDNLPATPDDSDPARGQPLSAKIEGQSADELARDRPPNADQTDQDQPHKPVDSTAASDVTEQRSATAEKPVPIASPKTKRLTKKEQKRRKLEAAYKDYDGSRQRITKMPPYRVLAINRGERAKVLSVKLAGDTERMLDAAESLVLPAEHPYRDFLKNCLRDAIARLLVPSLERELRREITEMAEEHAVQVFARNLRKLLLQPPVRDSRVLAIAPGFKSGCAVAALDEFGEVLARDKIFLVGKKEQRDQGRQKVAKLIHEHRLSIVAIGNGTACREVEQLVADVIGAELKDSATTFVVVNEAGASVYSTSQVGREELPDYDPVLRGAISIGRRLLDPLSELVKINPANIGVGLYQHDVKAKHLRESLDAVVESCVNYVGVDVNTASPSLLRYVSGLNQLTARRLYEYRREHGPFRNRQEFKRVTNLGDATFVQSAGFLRITDGGEPLDATWVHPESYELAGRVMGHLDSSVAELGGALRTSATTDGAATEASTQPKAMESDSVTEPTQDAIADSDAPAAPVSGERTQSTSPVAESHTQPTQDAIADSDAPAAPVSGERTQS
ncbi:MAG: transcriptional accessory protein Tex, partial [Planctomycetaceae bacterium]|nr:transcriptional accessory protein Tex [Planctomycetaceae bacterium]